MYLIQNSVHHLGNIRLAHLHNSDSLGAHRASSHVMFKSPGDGLPFLDGQILLDVRSAACWILLLGSSVVASSITIGSSSSSEVSRQITLPSAGISAKLQGRTRAYGGQGLKKFWLIFARCRQRSDVTLMTENIHSVLGGTGTYSLDLRFALLKCEKLSPTRDTSQPAQSSS